MEEIKRYYVGVMTGFAALISVLVAGVFGMAAAHTYPRTESFGLYVVAATAFLAAAILGAVALTSRTRLRDKRHTEKMQEIIDHV